MVERDTHRLQPDPPEGSRETIDRELERTTKKTGAEPAAKGDSGSPGFAGTPKK